MEQDAGQHVKGNGAAIARDGPLCLSGNIRIEVADGEVVTVTEAALCRCGASGDKPFCDDSHHQAGFSDEGVIQGGRLVPGRGDPATQGTPGQPAPVTIVCAKDGPLLVRGPLTVTGEDGVTSHGEKGALCRCGASAIKPFCDGTHRHIGFSSD